MKANTVFVYLVGASFILFSFYPTGQALGAEYEWVLVHKASSGGKKMDMYSSVSYVDGYLFVAGLKDETDGSFPKPYPVVLASQDRGDNWIDITSNLEDAGMFTFVTGLAFIDRNTGFAVVNDSIYKTNDQGASWSASKQQEQLNTVYFLDERTGFVLGKNGLVLKTTDAGSTWTTVSINTEADLTEVFFLNDGMTGWIAGTIGHEESDDEGNSLYVADHIAVFRTTDKGSTWKAEWQGPGEAAGKLFFVDESTGWLTSVQYMSGSNEQGIAKMYKTTDSGSTFNDVSLPTKVGEVQFGNNFKIPVHTQTVACMYFEPGGEGHMAGSANTGLRASQGMGGQGPYIFKLVDYWTHDGGTSWEHSDVGTITIGQDGGTPEDEGAMLNGVLLDLRKGWMVGTGGGRVYRYEVKCTSDSDCDKGLMCGDDGRCVPNTNGPCTTDEDCAESYVCGDDKYCKPGPCRNDDDCPGDLKCVKGVCRAEQECDDTKPAGEQGCAYGQFCYLGVCVGDSACFKNDQCSEGYHCDRDIHKCVPDKIPAGRCLDDQDCDSGQKCEDTWCVGQTGDTDIDADTDVDSDIDADTDLDTDSDGDTDTDADSDTDSDTDTDTGSCLEQGKACTKDSECCEGLTCEPVDALVPDGERVCTPSKGESGHSSGGCSSTRGDFGLMVFLAFLAWAWTAGRKQRSN